jgi:hypothetical protein
VEINENKSFTTLGCRCVYEEVKIVEILKLKKDLNLKIEN